MGAATRKSLPFRLRDYHPLRSPFPVTLPAVRLEEAFVTSWEVRSPPRCRPTTPHGQRLRAFAPVRFGLFPVRSPLLGESRLISLPPATEMFHFAGFASRAYLGFRPWIPCLDGTVGFPIRESPDHSLLSGSPGLIAAGHALHRLRLPRDPPSALTILAQRTPYSLVKDREEPPLLYAPHTRAQGAGPHYNGRDAGCQPSTTLSGQMPSRS